MSKIKLKDFVKYGQLFETYGKLLSDDRQNILKSYFEFNYTLAEIAQEKNISRQAVLDAISKGCQKLEEFENKLHFCEFKQTLEGVLENTNKDQILKEIENLLRKY